MKGKLIKIVVIAALVTFGYGVSYAYQSYQNAFNSLYGTAGSAIDGCELCHIDPGGGGTRNSYGNAFRAVSSHSSNPTGAFTTIQNADSDSDGYTNIAEINARTFPGDATSHPSAAAACTSYTYTLGACQPNNTAPVLSYTGIPSGCSGGAVPATTQPCSYTAPACTSYTYTLGACQPNNTAPVLSYTGIPSGCSGGLSPATIQPCTYMLPENPGTLMPPATSGLYWDDTYKTLGVGTATPDQSIHVKGDQDAITALRVENGNIIGASSPLAQEQFVLGPNANEHLIFQVLSDSHATMPRVSLLNAYTHDFYIRTNAVNVFKVIRTGAVADTLVLNGGKVGIGTSSPAHRIHLAGGAYSDGTTWVNASSREYKENIKDLTASEAVEALKELRAVKYNYKTDPTDRHVGFIAEDVPELVATKDRKGLSSMDIVAVVTKVMQTQQETIEAQQKTISALSEKLADLEREIRLKGSVASACDVRAAGAPGN